MNFAKLQDHITALKVAGLRIGDLEVQLAHFRMAEYYSTKVFDEYKLQPVDESANEYFDSFEAHDKPPIWAIHLLARGRTFRFTAHQASALRSVTHLRVWPEVTIADFKLHKGHIVELTFRFPQKSKVSLLHLGEDDFRKWVLSYRQLDSMKPDQVSKPALKPGERKAKPKSKPEEPSLNDVLASLGL